MVMKRAMARGTRAAGEELGNCDGGKSDDKGDEGGGQATATMGMTMETAKKWAVAMAMRLVGDKEGKGDGGKGNGDGNEGGGRQRGQGWHSLC
jgi:hypothetical protein